MRDYKSNYEFESNTWYWERNPDEVGAWTPVFIKDDTGYLMDGNVMSQEELKLLVMVKAVMPTV